MKKENYCMEVEGVDWQILSMEQFVTFVIFGLFLSNLCSY